MSNEHIKRTIKIKVLMNQNAYLYNSNKMLEKIEESANDISGVSVKRIWFAQK